MRLIIVSTGIAPRERSTTELAAPPRWRFSEEGALSEDGRQRLRDAANMCSYHARRLSNCRELPVSFLYAFASHNFNMTEFVANLIE